MNVFEFISLLNKITNNETLFQKTKSISEDKEFSNMHIYWQITQNSSNKGKVAIIRIYLSPSHLG